jgi:DDE superfamily endonuclease/Tc5 transposase DNA-binding domain/helix-turn-helix, Psq domain
MQSSSENLFNAIHDVKVNQISYRKAAEAHGVNLNTLYRHVNNSNIAAKPGPKSFLNEHEQNILKNYIVVCQQRGSPRRTQDIIDGAHFLLIKRLGGECQKPGKTWLRRFLTHHNLRMRKPEKLTKAAACLTEANIFGWFRSVYEILERDGQHHLLADPTRIFNADETFILLNPTKGKVAAPTGTKYVYEVSPGNEKEGITAMCGFSADGRPLKPYLIFSYDRIPKIVREEFPHERAVLQATKNGWMDSERCGIYLKGVAKEVKERGIDLPRQKIVMFWDRHASHMTLEVCEIASELGIILIGLYPNSTFLTQPCDVAIFRSLKTHWHELVRETKFNDVNKNITKVEFSKLFI